MNEQTTEQLKLLFSANTNKKFREKTLIKFKEILINSNLNELNLNNLMDLDKRVYTSRKNKRLIFTNALSKMGFIIEKRKKAFIRKRIIRNCLNSLPEYVFKSFWIIQINKND